MRYHGLKGVGEVSRLCLGTLTMGYLQRNLPVEQGAALIERAVSQGVNFVDTAEYYRTYSYIAEALKRAPELVVCTKTYAYTKQLAKDSLELALRCLNRDYIDIFMLHEQESEHTLRGHSEALDYFFEMKERGVIRAVGVSTHTLACVRATARYPIDVVQVISNYAGFGLHDGTVQDMERECAELNRRGVFVLGMKPLGGGGLLGERERALQYALSTPSLQSVAMGMQSAAEVDYNCALFNGQDCERFAGDVDAQPRELLVQDWCRGCGECVSRCKNGGIEIDKSGVAQPNERCVRCGYCVGVCPEYALKII